MASSLMHLAAASQLLNRIETDDPNRFLLGSILPDAIRKTDAGWSFGHYRRKLQNGANIIDSSEFYHQYRTKLPGNGLFLGYYFHLIQDIIFRNMLYYDWGYMKKRSDPQSVDNLHSDYWFLNDYLIKKYQLVNTLSVPESIEYSDISNDGELTLEEFLQSIEPQFHAPAGSTKLLSNEMADAFILRCVNVCSAEYEAVKKGCFLFQPEDNAWGLQRNQIIERQS